MPEQEITRRAMYDLVWSRPMTKVAEDLGISNVALKNICDKHRVPTPPRGYWAKRDADKPTKQIQFHSTSDPQHEHIVIHGSRNNLAPEVCEVLEQERERRKSTQDGLARRSRTDSPAAGRAPGNLGNCESSAQSKARRRRSHRGERAWLLWDRGWRC
jgi:hypothetical protein